MNDTIDLPLYDFFNALRKNGFPMGINEYYLLIHALQRGFGINKEKGQLDKEASLKLCKTLWLKPNQSRYIFESLFEDHFKNISPRPENQKSDTSPSIDSTLASSDPLPEDTKPSEQDKDEKALSQPIAPRPQEWIKFVLGNPEGTPLQVPNQNQKPQRKFLFREDYFDLTKRQMQQVCRFLPVSQVSQEKDEIDIEATVHQFAKSHFTAPPVFKQQERITNQVILLTDHQGSMLAFEALANTLFDALRDAFQTHLVPNQHKVARYYFYNVLQEYCYLDPSHTQYKETTQIINRLNPQDSAIIIISDAGAARGSNSDSRFKATLRFIIKLRNATEKIIWLNPLPESRWEGTTARRIARFVSMFSLTTQHQLQQAINKLRGK